MATKEETVHSIRVRSLVDHLGTIFITLTVLVMSHFYFKTPQITNISLLTLVFIIVSLVSRRFIKRTAMIIWADTSISVAMIVSGTIVSLLDHNLQFLNMTTIPVAAICILIASEYRKRHLLVVITTSFASLFLYNDIFLAKIAFVYYLFVSALAFKVLEIRKNLKGKSIELLTGHAKHEAKVRFSHYILNPLSVVKGNIFFIKANKKTITESLPQVRDEINKIKEYTEDTKIDEKFIDDKKYLSKLLFEIHSSADKLQVLFPIFYILYFFFHHQAQDFSEDLEIYDIAFIVGLPLTLWFFSFLIYLAKRNYSKSILWLIFSTTIVYQVFCGGLIFAHNHFDDWYLLVTISQIPAMFLLARTNIKFATASLLIGIITIACCPVSIFLKILTISLLFKAYSLVCSSLNRTQMTLLTEREVLANEEKIYQSKLLEDDVRPLIYGCEAIVNKEELSINDIENLDSRCDKINTTIKKAFS